MDKEFLDAATPDTKAVPKILAADQKSYIPVPTVAIQMRVANVNLTLPDSHPKITLEEVLPPHRRLIIKTGAMEGIAVSYAQNKIRHKRPITHTLIMDILANFSLCVDQIMITKAVGEVFLTELVISGPKGKKNIDARPSDALAIALYHTPEVPIMVSEEVLTALGY
ncbi:MAG: bifunctional nuclease family protein [Firmicutes bacterium]|jgi:hypothetical protein|nr:bifunctional nuclease family protein [Bacillota bacterium]